MNWLSLIRRTLAGGRKPATPRGAVETGTRNEPRANSEPNSTFGYGALVIGNPNAHSHRSH
jgi:hypothetical protein